MSQNTLPLAVDLDGTLLKSDMLLESFLAMVRNNPFTLLLAPFWLLKGKAWLKLQIALRSEIDVSHLPYNEPLLAYLHTQKAQGRKIYLATATHQKYAQQVADYLELFDGVFASSPDVNLSGIHKRDALVAAFGERQFVYAGNEAVDVPIWKASAAAIVVGDRATRSLADESAPIEQHFDSHAKKLKPVLKAFRVHQWVKNALIFVPLFAAHQFDNPVLFLQGILAFLAFSACASSVYLINDMLDLAEDRQHPTKCKRPFAAGTLPILTGMVSIPLLLLAAIFLCLFLPAQFALVLAAYYALTFAYSFWLKRVVLIDVVTLALLYTIRIIAGAAAIAVPLSFWLLAFSTFLFLSLAILKRYTELLVMREKNATKALGRGYAVNDFELLASLGGSAGYLSVLVLALYINSPEIRALYPSPELMWPTCLIMLYWVSRVWIVAHRGNMNDDPIVFAIKDKTSLICGFLVAIFMVVASGI
ncbi:prenyltransferase, UbiA family [gamma proteobacterium HdN1]|nr:prenyltransferase, UbiA family [gamma proteobacterium HdN1]